MTENDGLLKDINEVIVTLSRNIL